MKRLFNIIISIIFIFSLSGCGGSTSKSDEKKIVKNSEQKEAKIETKTETEINKSQKKTLSVPKTWNKTAGNTNGYDWKTMNKYQKEDIVKGVINSWNKSGNEVVKSYSWFISNIDDFYGDGTNDTTLAEAMSMIAVTGSAFKKDQQKIQKSMSKVSNSEEKIWQYCMNRWEYYDDLEGGYAGDKYTEQVFKDAGRKFGISASKAEEIWNKVDRAKYGLD